MLETAEISHLGLSGLKRRATHGDKSNLFLKNICTAQELRPACSSRILNRKNDVPMIYIKEANLQKNILTIEVDGMLDDESIPILKKVCDHHLASGKRVALDLRGIIHITREGRSYLKKIQSEVSIDHLPDFVKIENT